MAVLGAVVHRHTAEVGALTVPWGLALAIVAAGALAWAAGRLVRVGSAWFGLGWTLALLLQQLAPGGGYLVGGDALGWGFTLGGLGVIGLVVLRKPRLGA